MPHSDWKYEVFWPADAVVGKFKEEPIHLRSSVQKVRSKEAWFTQFARNLRSGEEPVKTIQLPKRKKKGMLLPDEDPYEPGGTQHLYGEWQTEPYVPPVISTRVSSDWLNDYTLNHVNRKGI